MPDLKLGRRPAKNAKALLFGRLFTGNLPAHPAGVDYGTRFTDWQLLGNDQYGDCVAVTWANQRALVTTVLGGHTVYPTMDQVIDLYKTQNPGFPADDNGMDIQTCLEHLVSAGGPDGVKALAFAKVDHTNLAELQAAHAIFGQVWYGVDVLDANMTQFNQGQPWDYVAGARNDGGHSITGVGYDPDSTMFVTWARETEWTEAYRAHQVFEAWVVIWPEHMGAAAFLDGVDQVALAADYYAITGRPFPSQPTPAPQPDPAPTPAPSPVPGPTDIDADLWARVKPWATGRHVGINHDAAQDVLGWARGKGFEVGEHEPKHAEHD